MSKELDAGKLLAVAWEGAEAAGTLIRESWQEAKQIRYKSSIDLVTSVDHQSEQRIVRILQEQFPDHSILAEEETTLTGPENNLRWIIDPMDGTTNFAHRYPQVSVSIAFEKNGEVIVGLVYDPLRGERFQAVKGRGAFLNGHPIQTSDVSELDKALLASGFPYDRRQRAGYYLAFFEAFLMRAQGIRRNGSAALDLCYLACGRIDGFWEFKLHAWDTAAAGLIVREAGGILSNFSGNEFSIWGEETLASNGHLHAEMVRVIMEVNREQNTLTPR